MSEGNRYCRNCGCKVKRDKWGWTHDTSNLDMMTACWGVPRGETKGETLVADPVDMGVVVVEDER